jgi:hypothetical protein
MTAVPVALISELMRVRIKAPESDWLKKRLATILVLEDSEVEVEFANAFEPASAAIVCNRAASTLVDDYTRLAEGVAEEITGPKGIVACWPDDFKLIQDRLSQLQTFERRLRAIATESPAALEAGVSCQKLADTVARRAAEKKWGARPENRTG